MTNEREPATLILSEETYKFLSAKLWGGGLREAIERELAKGLLKRLEPRKADMSRHHKRRKARTPKKQIVWHNDAGFLPNLLDGKTVIDTSAECEDLTELYAGQLHIYPSGVTVFGGDCE